MTQEDRAYLLRRAEAEGRLSFKACTLKAAQAHAALADAYESRLGDEIQKSQS